jgi:hypothetical protein
LIPGKGHPFSLYHLTPVMTDQCTIYKSCFCQFFSHWLGSGFLYSPSLGFTFLVTCLYV